jgi:hypothetical protein
LIAQKKPTGDSGGLLCCIAWLRQLELGLKTDAQIVIDIAVATAIKVDMNLLIFDK